MPRLRPTPPTSRVDRQLKWTEDREPMLTVSPGDRPRNVGLNAPDSPTHVPQLPRPCAVQHYLTLPPAIGGLGYAAGAVAGADPERRRGRAGAFRGRWAVKSSCVSLRCVHTGCRLGDVRPRSATAGHEQITKCSPRCARGVLRTARCAAPLGLDGDRDPTCDALVLAVGRVAGAWTPRSRWTQASAIVGFQLRHLLRAVQLVDAGRPGDARSPRCPLRGCRHDLVATLIVDTRASGGSMLLLPYAVDQDSAEFVERAGGSWNSARGD